MPSPNWLKKAVIYQIFTGRWEGEVEDNHIKYIDNFQNLTNRNWQALLNLGINTFYFLGIFDNEGPLIVGCEGDKDLNNPRYHRMPSVFSIRDHKKIHPHFGSLNDFKELINHIHSLQGKVIIDFVPNHTSTVNYWVETNPDYYVQDNGQFLQEFNGDVYKLNYENKNLRLAMIDVLKWIAATGVDGVRCDMAHLVTPDFWHEAISEIKKQYPDFAFIAEAYPNSLFDYKNIHALYDAGFDAIYNNSLFENIKNVIAQNKPLDFLVENIKSSKFNQPGLAVNYFFNHDDPPLDNKTAHHELDLLSQEYIETLIALILFIPDIPFFYNGSLIGKNRKVTRCETKKLLPKIFQAAANNATNNGGCAKSE